RVIMQVATDGENALVSVQDFGIGIAEVYQEKIFERFYQVSEPEEKTYPGLGIGLYIVRQIIKRHQGHLCVQSRKGEGSIFSFSVGLRCLRCRYTRDGACRWPDCHWHSYSRLIHR